MLRGGGWQPRIILLHDALRLLLGNLGTPTTDSAKKPVRPFSLVPANKYVVVRKRKVFLILSMVPEF